MKPMVILFLGLLAASSASATLDPGPVVLGIYFDSYAENNCLATNAGNLRIVLDNLTAYEREHEQVRRAPPAAPPAGGSQ